MLAAASLVAAGCGGSPRSNVAQLGSSGTPSAAAQGSGALAVSRCMRSHGVPNFPDPGSAGATSKPTPQQLGVSSSQFQAAQAACRRVLPNGGQPTHAALQQSWRDFRSFARCMRAHGVSNWPDPTRYPQHPERPTFDLQSAGIDPNSPQLTTRLPACVPLLRGTNPQRLGMGS